MAPEHGAQGFGDQEYDTRWGVAEPWHTSDSVGPILLGTRYDPVGRVIATISILPGRVIETIMEPGDRTASEAGQAALEAIRELSAGRYRRPDGK
jgi:hypothetical protein